MVASYIHFNWAAPSCTPDTGRAEAEAEGDIVYTVRFDSAVAVRSWARKVVAAWSCSADDRVDRSMADTWAGIVPRACAWDAEGTYTADSKDCAGTAYCYYAGVPPFRAQDWSSFHFFIFSYLFPACRRASPSPQIAHTGSSPSLSFYSSSNLHAKTVTVLPLDHLHNDLAGAAGFLFIIAIEMPGGRRSLVMNYKICKGTAMMRGDYVPSLPIKKGSTGQAKPSSGTQPSSTSQLFRETLAIIYRANNYCTQLIIIQHTACAHFSGQEMEKDGAGGTGGMTVHQWDTILFF